MDIEWIKHEQAELERLLGSKKVSIEVLNKPYGFSVYPNECAAVINCIDRSTPKEKCLLERIGVLEKENQELRHKLVLKTIGMK